MLLTNNSNSNNVIENRHAMHHQPLNILVLCTGNSARSVMAEGLFNGLASEYFQAFSAGSQPTGRVNPFALEQIAPLALPYEARSKSWDEFAQADTVELDLVITVCGNAAQEICPHFVGTPQRIHWGLPDPAGVSGSDDVIRRAFNACYRVFEWRIQQLVDQLRAQSNADIVELMQGLSHQFPPHCEMSEHGFAKSI